MYKPNWDKTGVQFYNELIDYVRECFHATQHMIDRKGFLLMNTVHYNEYVNHMPGHASEIHFLDTLFTFEIVVDDKIKHPVCVIEVL